MGGLSTRQLLRPMTYVRFWPINGEQVGQHVCTGSFRKVIRTVFVSGAVSLSTDRIGLQDERMSWRAAPVSIRSTSCFWKVEQDPGDQPKCHGWVSLLPFMNIEHLYYVYQDISNKGTCFSKSSCTSFSLVFLNLSVFVSFRPKCLYLLIWQSVLQFLNSILIYIVHKSHKYDCDSIPPSAVAFVSSSPSN